MRLYLVQHGEAKSKDEDPERPLTEKGIKDVQKVAGFVSKSIPSLNEIRHSGKLRAKQTAEIIGKHLKFSYLIAVKGMAPLDDVIPFAKELTKENKDLMLVGHLPFMEKLAAKLLFDDPNASAVKFKKGGIVCLEMEDDTWKVCWMVTPDII